MTDISHYIGNDLSWGPTGDLAVASTPKVTQQRVLRRLLTNPGDYIWNLGYGGGLGLLVGKPAHTSAISGIIRSQMLQEAAVAQSPAPSTKVYQQTDGSVIASVQYADSTTGTQQTLYVPIS